MMNYHLFVYANFVFWERMFTNTQLLNHCGKMLRWLLRRHIKRTKTWIQSPAHPQFQIDGNTYMIFDVEFLRRDQKTVNTTHLDKLKERNPSPAPSSTAIAKLWPADLKPVWGGNSWTTYNVWTLQRSRPPPHVQQKLEGDLYVCDEIQEAQAVQRVCV